MTEELPRNYCPVCGTEFEEILEENYCENCKRTSKKESLISEEEDYE